MEKKIESTIGELKQIVIRLRRSADELDTIIQQIEEVDSNDKFTKDFLNCFIDSQASYREGLKERSNFNTIGRDESLIWKRLKRQIKIKS